MRYVGIQHRTHDFKDKARGERKDHHDNVSKRRNASGYAEFYSERGVFKGGKWNEFKYNFPVWRLQDRMGAYQIIPRGVYGKLRNSMEESIHVPPESIGYPTATTKGSGESGKRKQYKKLVNIYQYKRREHLTSHD